MSVIYKTIRRKNGWSQKKLSEKMDIPISEIRVYEKENIVPSLSYTRRFMKIFGVSWEVLQNNQ